jgi:putative cofactor-binding repeat protein
MTPPLTLSDLGDRVRVGRKLEFMQELVGANGTHTIGNESEIKSVTVTQKSSAAKNYPVEESVEVIGDQGTVIAVEMDDEGEIDVGTNNPLTPDFVAGWGRYAEADSTIVAIVIDGGANILQPNGQSVRVDINFQ